MSLSRLRSLAPISAPIAALIPRALRALLLAGAVSLVHAEDAPPTHIDPLNSPSWAQMHARMLNGEPYAFSDKITVLSPDSAEDPANVPVSVHIAAGIAVKRVVVFADLNPIQKVIELEPFEVPASFGFRIKLEQATPLRAAALTDEGIWLVGGRWVDSAGGGCTQPSAGRVSGNWHETIGQFRALTFGEAEHISRVRFRIMHPMDTGLSPGIPAFYIDRITVSDAADVPLATLNVFEPISENPYFTLDLADLAAERQPLKFAVHDIGGNEFNHQAAAE